MRRVLSINLILLGFAIPGTLSEGAAQVSVAPRPSHVTLALDLGGQLHADVATGAVHLALGSWGLGWHQLESARENPRFVRRTTYSQSHPEERLTEKALTVERSIRLGSRHFLRLGVGLGVLYGDEAVPGGFEERCRNTMIFGEYCESQDYDMAPVSPEPSPVVEATYQLVIKRQWSWTGLLVPRAVFITGRASRHTTMRGVLVGMTWGGIPHE